MNKLTVLILLMALSFMACKNNTDSSKTDSTVKADQSPEEVVVAATNIEELPNDSNFDMEDAIEAYEEGDFASAADYIGATMKDLAAESEGFNKAAKAKVNASIASLKILEGKIREGEMDNVDTMLDAFAQAEMTVAHNYLVFSQVYIEEEPAKAQSALKKAITKMENAADKMEGATKAEANKLITETKVLLKKADNKTNKVGDELGAKAEELAAWLKKHAKEIGVNAPPADPNE